MRSGRAWQLTAPPSLRQAMTSSAALPALDDLAPPVWVSARAHAALLFVMRLLPLDARARAACACRTWRGAALDPDLCLRVLYLDGDSRGALRDDTVARLCARAGATLRELRLDSPACAPHVTAPGVLAALRAGGCTGVLRLALPVPERGAVQDVRYSLSMRQAQELAAACPALEHTACGVRCVDPDDVATACALLPGPLTLHVISRRLATVRAAQAAHHNNPRVATWWYWG